MYKIAFILFFCLNQSIAFSKQENNVLIDSVNTGLKSKEEEKIYEYAEVMPKYPGGPEALMKYLMSNIKYPSVWAEADPVGKVIVKFYVDIDGSVKNASVKKNSVGREIEGEVLRVINSMPKWTPATQNGKPVMCYYTLPVTIEIR